MSTSLPHPNRPLRVCILTPEPNELGGVQIHTRAVYRMLEAWGWEPTIAYAVNAGPDVSLVERLRFTWKMWRAAPRPYPHGPDPFAGLRTRVVAAPPVPYWLYYLVPQFILGRALAGFDRIIAVSGSAHCALPLALRGVPYLLWIGTDYEEELLGKAEMNDAWARATLNAWNWPLLVAQERHALRKAGTVLAWPHTVQHIGQRFPAVAKKLSAILFPVDTGRFKPPGAQRPSLPYGKFLLLTARISDPRKNVALLLDAFAQVRAQRPDLSLVTVGGRPPEDLLRQRDRLGLQEAVHFIEERLSREELVTHYQGAELFVLSSVQEGLSISVLEAIACGTPVVSTRCGGPEGVIVDGETGLLVENKDADALAEGILSLLNDPARLDAMRARCVAFAAQRLAEEVIAEQLAAAFDAVYASGGASAARNTPGWKRLVAAGWALLVAALYFMRQVPPQWPKVYERFIAPLLGG